MSMRMEDKPAEGLWLTIGCQGGSQLKARGRSQLRLLTEVAADAQGRLDVDVVEVNPVGSQLGAEWVLVVAV